MRLRRRHAEPELEPFRSGLGEFQGRVAISEFFRLESHQIRGYVIVALVQKDDAEHIGVISSRKDAWPWTWDLLDAAIHKVRAVCR